MKLTTLYDMLILVGKISGRHRNIVALLLLLLLVLVFDLAAHGGYWC